MRATALASRAMMAVSGERMNDGPNTNPMQNIHRAPMSVGWTDGPHKVVRRSGCTRTDVGRGHVVAIRVLHDNFQKARQTIDHAQPQRHQRANQISHHGQSLLLQKPCAYAPLKTCNPWDESPGKLPLVHHVGTYLRSRQTDRRGRRGSGALADRGRTFSDTRPPC